MSIDDHIDRRHFLQFSTATTAFSTVPRTPTQTIEQAAPFLELRAWTAQGKPMPEAVMQQIYFSTLMNPCQTCLE